MNFFFFFHWGAITFSSRIVRSFGEQYVWILLIDFFAKLPVKSEFFFSLFDCLFLGVML